MDSPFSDRSQMFFDAREVLCLEDNAGMKIIGLERCLVNISEKESLLRTKRCVHMDVCVCGFVVGSGVIVVGSRLVLNALLPEGAMGGYVSVSKGTAVGMVGARQLDVGERVEK